jgi:protein O-mannosyl-transferase
MSTATPEESRGRRRPMARRPAAATPATEASDRRLPAALAWSAIFLVALNLAVFAHVGRFGFVSFDDPTYVSENARVAGGLTWPAVSWAFTTTHAGYWIPLTWLSFMADVQAAGNGAAAHHVVNLGLHTLNALLLFALLARLTGDAGKSLFVAALFAAHPLHVESVAWITERKDVLSTFFVLLALLAYERYARRPSVARYLGTTAWFACALMAKPLAVTFPLLALLVDVWPLGRVSFDRSAGWWPVVREKLPLVVLAGAAGVVTVMTQREVGAVSGVEAVGVGMRLATALTSYAIYIWKALWPTGLSVFYPYETSIPAWQAGLSALLLASVSAAAVRWRRERFLIVGWLWYLVALAPMAGFVQAGNQSRADRFTYLPLIGLFVIVAWGVPRLVGGRLRALAALAIAAVAACAVTARVQAESWMSDETLWTHALAVMPDNFFAHNSLGRMLYARGDAAAAAGHFAQAVRLAPAFYDSRNNLGIVALEQGRFAEATDQFRAAVALKPTAEALNGLSASLAQQGQLDEAIEYGRQAVDLDPAFAEARHNLGLSLARLGRLDEALAQLSEASRLKPGLPSMALARAEVLSRMGRSDEAIEAYTEAARLAPERAEVRDMLGFALAAQGRIGEAVSQFSEAIRLAPGFKPAHYHLGLALAGTGRFREASASFNEVLRLDPQDADARRALARIPAESR